MGMDGAGTQNQFFGNLEVSQATRQQAQHLHLSCRQPGWIGWWGRSCDRRWGWLLPLCGEGLLRRHGSSLGPGGSERSLSQMDTRSRDRALIISEFDRRDGDANGVAEGLR